MHTNSKKFILGFIYGLSLLLIVELFLWIWDITTQKNHVNIISVFSVVFSGLVFGLFALTKWGNSLWTWKQNG